MSGTYRVRITPRALADIQSIFDYISRDSASNAAKMIARILDGIDSLDTFPGRYDVPRVGYVKGRTIRSMPVQSYLVRYRIDEPKKTVHILRVRHGARRRS